MNSRLYKLLKIGQSIWLDNISRGLIKSGELKSLIEKGIRGVTSNPTIFEKAILGSNDYDEAIQKLISRGLKSEEILEELMIEDIKDACDLFSEVYKESNGNDGFVSIEVNPLLAYNTEGTIEAVKRIWEKINRPNLMVKIPATREGLKAIEESIARGINVNVTLIFSIQRYIEVAEAYINGIKRRLENGEDVSNVNSVASVFVSRLDTLVDNEIVKMINQGKPELTKFLGKAAVANTKLLYQEFKKIFLSEKFDELKSKGAKIQRPLWASTSTKNPMYSQLLYVDELFAPYTVNTLPPKTLEIMLEESIIEERIEKDLEGAKKIIEDLKSLGIDFEQIFEKLEKDGVKAFEDSYLNLLSTLEQKVKILQDV
ncbi:MAG: transaldolase [Ignavibacteria bacterium]|jgi:transaldolase|nr:transaldolase [Ignavibacteria bacterium]MDH7528578.1 transaldolase [Ignavibacteria bacterium]